MNNFIYYAPTKIVFGKDTEQQVGELIKQQKCCKVMIHYGGASAKKSGLLERIKQSLDDAGIAYVELGGVVPNPRLSLVYQGIELCRQNGVDFILAVGGGSVIDSAKAIAYGVADGGDVWDLFEHTRQATDCLPLGCVLTIAAAGSEMSGGSVITKDKGMVKRAYDDDLSRPKFAVLNPQLTISLPDYQTACGAADILMHTMERYFTHGGNMEITDVIAEALMRTVMHNAQILRDQPHHYAARAEIMWAGSLSHNDLTGCGNQSGDWATHMLEHEVSGMFDVAHGAGLASLWGSWARYVYRNCLHRFERFAVHVMGVTPTVDSEQTALKGIEAMEDFFRSINMPVSLAELGVHPTEEQIATMAEMCSLACGGQIGSAKVLKQTDMANIYRMAK